MRWRWRLQHGCQAYSSPTSLQAGGDNKALDITVPAGITRLFKSNLDWQLYSDNQEQLNDRKVGSPFPARQSVGTL